jgi:hypothetical protein
MINYRLVNGCWMLIILYIIFLCICPPYPNYRKYWLFMVNYVKKMILLIVYMSSCGELLSNVYILNVCGGVVISLCEHMHL